MGRAMRSRKEPIKNVARSFRADRNLILNGFEADKEFSSGIVEGLNNKRKLTLRKAYGFRELGTVEIALYHALGRLTQPKLTHEFCRGGYFVRANNSLNFSATSVAASL